MDGMGDEIFFRCFRQAQTALSGSSQQVSPVSWFQFQPLQRLDFKQLQFFGGGKGCVKNSCALRAAKGMHDGYIWASIARHPPPPTPWLWVCIVAPRYPSPPVVWVVWVVVGGGGGGGRSCICMYMNVYVWCECMFLVFVYDYDMICIWICMCICYYVVLRSTT